MTVPPEVLWTQRDSKTNDGKNFIFLTVLLWDIDPPTLVWNLTSSSVSFQAKTKDGAEYAFELDLFNDVDPKLSRSTLTNRSLVASIRKKEKMAEPWPRLTKDKIKRPFIKTDFSKWTDEDEDDGLLPQVIDIDDMDFDGSDLRRNDAGNDDYEPDPDNEMVGVTLIAGGHIPNLGPPR
ncbi:hypothetical protein DXG01_012482 [Tephrocybe rancida]|nr:hypothetical protein DXG01_012482 [Tephrocybe rancida]